MHALAYQISKLVRTLYSIKLMQHLLVSTF